MKLTHIAPLLTTLSFTTAQTPAPYTDPKSNITFNYFTLESGFSFGLALPLTAGANVTPSADVIVTIGGKGAGWSGVSLGGGMTNKLLAVAWDKGDGSIAASLRQTP
jgi:hypothetical protein